MTAEGPTTVRDADCINTSFPLFSGLLAGWESFIEVDTFKMAVAIISPYPVSKIKKKVLFE